MSPRMSATIAFLFVLLGTGSALSAPPEPTPPRFPSREAAVEAYVNACDAAPVPPPPEPGESGHEGQGGSRAWFDCPNEGAACEGRCFATHRRCQSVCADRCGDCRRACAAGDAACVRACAERRADCAAICDAGVDECDGTCTDESCSGYCVDANRECMHVSVKRAMACDRVQGEAYYSCVGDGTERWDTMGRCARRAKKLDAFCRRVWATYGGAFDELVIDDHEAPSFRPADELAARCTPEAQCPQDYARVAPYLGAFCAGALGESSLESLREQVRARQISKRSLSIVFNALGAMHGYDFKKETWLNGLFYGSGEWLPPTCRAAVRTLSGPREVPLAITKLRDQVKKIWAKAR